MAAVPVAPAAADDTPAWPVIGSTLVAGAFGWLLQPSNGNSTMQASAFVVNGD
jgi:hypothetical protein